MKVGDYVRTHDGRIDKIVDIKNDFIYIENSDYGYRENYLKSSPNIIDLIEVGDFVNGHRVLDIAEAPKKVLYLNDISQKGALLPRENIKSVLTKEQFSQMEYRIGE